MESLKENSIEREKMTRSFEKGALFMALSGISGSFFALFIKLGIKIPSIPILVFFRFVIPFLMILPFAFFHKVFKIKEIIHELRKQLIRGLFVAAGQYCFFYYLVSASLLNATMILNFSMVMIVLISKFFYKHHVSGFTWFTVFFSLGGVYLILKPDQGIFDASGLLGLFAAFSLAVSQIIYGKHAEEGDMVKNIFYFLLIPTIASFVVLSCLAIVSPETMESMELSISKNISYSAVCLLGMGVSSLSNQLLRGIAYVHARPSVLAPLMYIAVVFSASFDYFLFNHIPDFASLIGILIILFGTIMQFIANRRNV